jgi:hypothetical protein
MQTLGKLAGDGQYDLEDGIKNLGTGIKAWPDSGLEDRHVNAFAGLARLLRAPSPARCRNVPSTM